MAYIPPNVNGQATMANSEPVVIASDQTSIPVTDNGGSLTVDGSVTANLGTLNGAATSAKQDTGNTSLSSIDGKITAVNTGAVVVSSSALPTGAATAAKQPAIGTAGTSSADVLTVQGRASMTPLLTDGSATTQPVSGSVTVTGVSTATKQSDGSQKTQVVDGSGNVIGATSNALDINIKSGNPSTTPAGSNVIGKVGIDQTTPGTTNLVALAANQSVNNAQIAGTATAVNTGNSSAGTQRVVIATDQPAFSVNNAVVDVAPSTVNITVVDSGSTSTVSSNGQALVTGTPTANSFASFTLAGIETVRVQVSGTWTGTLASEMSMDSGTTWSIVGLHQGAFTAGSFTSNLIGGCNVAGATNFRMRATATITGTATVRVTESFNTSSVYIANAAPSGNYISLLNSTTATLTSGSVFTGTSEDVSNFSEIRISVIASHASATDGLSIQQSSDNTNWDITDTYTIPATTGKTFAVPRQARYFRVVYTNGGTGQSSFRLQTILNRTGTIASSQRSQDAYSNENDLEQTWSFNSVWNGATWDRMVGDTTGINVRQKASTATLSNVAASASNVTLLSANTARIGATITNDSSALVYIKFGTTASTTSYTVVLAGAASAPFSYYEVPAGYTGRIDAIWASAAGNARITEIS